MTRQIVPATERIAAVGLALGLDAVVRWTFAQHDAYDPTERDLPIELLMVDRPPIEIFKVPLKR